MIKKNNNYGVLTLLFVLFILIVVFVVELLFGSVSAIAQDTPDYTLLEPLRFIEDAPRSGQTSAGVYIAGAVKLVIALAGVLAVVMIVVGGIQYMSTDAFSGKSAGKERITNAIWGLVLVMAAWMIIYTVNPNLVSFKLEISRTRPGSSFNFDDFQLGSTTPPITTGSGCLPPSCGQPWPSDQTEREQLVAVGVSIWGSRTPSTCRYIGERGCTSAQGLRFTTINALGDLKTACNCAITITGGTEYWNHGNFMTENNTRTQHRPENGKVVDLAKNGALDTYITSRGTRISTQLGGSRNSCSNLGPAYRVGGANGAIYVNEATHWHVCYP